MDKQAKQLLKEGLDKRSEPVADEESLAIQLRDQHPALSKEDATEAASKILKRRPDFKVDNWGAKDTILNSLLYGGIGGAAGGLLGGVAGGPEATALAGGIGLGIGGLQGALMPNLSRGIAGPAPSTEREVMAGMANLPLAIPQLLTGVPAGLQGMGDRAEARRIVNELKRKDL